MKKKLIEFGRWNRYYYYILVLITAKFIKKDILGFGYFHSIIYDSKISKHPIIILLLVFYQIY